MPRVAACPSSAPTRLHELVWLHVGVSQVHTRRADSVRKPPPFEPAWFGSLCASLPGEIGEHNGLCETPSVQENGCPITSLQRSAQVSIAFEGSRKILAWLDESGCAATSASSSRLSGWRPYRAPPFRAQPPGFLDAILSRPGGAQRRPSSRSCLGILQSMSWLCPTAVTF